MSGPGWFMGTPYVPQGFVDPQDEAAQQLALVNPWLACQSWEYEGVACHLDKGDEAFEPNVYAYIPTEYEVAAAVAVANMQALQQAGDPVQTRTPALAQLTQSLYQQTAALWQELSAADTGGW